MITTSQNQMKATMQSSNFFPASSLVQSALNHGFLRNDSTGSLDCPERAHAVFYSLDRLYSNLSSISSCFPSSFSSSSLPSSSSVTDQIPKPKIARTTTPIILHAVAVKACPLVEIQRLVANYRCPGSFDGKTSNSVDNSPFGAECASLGEIEVALAAGFSPERIVFDSPCKTISELMLAMERGFLVNLDSFGELDRVAELLTSNPHLHPNVRIGLRINPQIGSGSIEYMSTATATSKFGIPIGNPKDRQKIIDAYLKHSFLSCIHCHVGSQGCPLSLLIQGAQSVVSLAQEVNQQRKQAGIPSKINIIDIGGGLPVNYASSEDSPTYAEYALELRNSVPQLFSGEFSIITEFGRSTFAKTACAISRIEYVKEQGDKRIAITHFGVDLAPRTVYMPTHFPLRFTILDSKGNEKKVPESEWTRHDIGGPCCFSGDLLCRDRSLPPISPGDWLFAHDFGAYTLSHYTFYNSRPMPGVYLFNGKMDDNASGDHNVNLTFSCLKEPQSPHDVLVRVWNK